ncbi:MAG: YbjQ family protein [Candidatus Methanofastidiosa archaeon]|nr:YbjQ family protein [Candidatus Methanofastidiosa archaeon]
MIITTANDIPGQTVTEVLGIVKGNTIRAKHIGKDIVAGLRNLVGGELKEYTEMITEAREEAMARMEREATAMGADAIVGVRITTSQVATGAAEILAYGTAVKL